MAAKKHQSQLSLDPESSSDGPLGAPEEGGNDGKLVSQQKKSTKEKLKPDVALQKKQAAEELSFEGAIERLAAIVEQLEAEGQPLDTSLKLFEEGIRLARESQARLESAEKRVEELLAYDDKGEPIVDELDSD